MHLSITPLMVALFIVMVGTLFFGALVYVVECTDWNEETSQCFVAGSPRCAGLTAPSSVASTPSLHLRVFLCCLHSVWSVDQHAPMLLLCRPLPCQPLSKHPGRR